MLNEVDFSGLILGFSSAALYYMGEAALEGKNDLKVNMELAKQNIDLIMLLREKTKGNLTSDESDLINQVLIDLQKKFVAKANKIS